LTELCTKHHCVKRGKKSHNVNCTKGVADLSTLTTVFHLQYAILQFLLQKYNENQAIQNMDGLGFFRRLNIWEMLQLKHFTQSQIKLLTFFLADFWVFYADNLVV